MKIRSVLCLFLTFQVSNAVAIWIHKTSWIYLVENCVLPPALVADLARGQSTCEQKYNHDDAGTLHDLNNATRDHTIPLYAVRLDGKKEQWLASPYQRSSGKVIIDISTDKPSRYCSTLRHILFKYEAITSICPKELQLSRGWFHPGNINGRR